MSTPSTTAWMHRAAQVMRTPAAAQFLLAARDPRGTQRRRLMALLRANAGTEFGRAHGFGSIRDEDDFRARVPLMSHATLKPWVDRLLAGERGLLTAEAPVFFGRSSGSTGTPKAIPITEAFRADFQRAALTSMWFAYWRAPEAFRHKILYFVAPRTTGRAPSGAELGNISGYNFTEMPELIRSLYAWPYDLVEIEDTRTREYVALHVAAQQKISIIAGIFPVGVLQLMQGLDAHAEALAEHLSAGTWPDWLVWTDAQRQAFEAYRRVDAQAAARCRAAAQAAPTHRCALVFPELRAVFCWRSATAGLYVPALKERLGPQVQLFDTVYSATEGWSSVVCAEDEDGGPVALTSHVYEFLPERVVLESGGDVEAMQGARTLMVDELEDGQRYSIVLTTSAGLYRYVLGDLVEVCGMWRGVPRIKFSRKHGAAYSMGGEALEEPQVTRAVGEVLGERGLRAMWFACVPVVGARPHYDLFLEPEGAPWTEAQAEGFAEAVDEALCHINYSWQVDRRAGALDPPRLRLVRPGAYADQLERWASQGRAAGQLKLNHLIVDPERLPCALPDDLI